MGGHRAGEHHPPAGKTGESQETVVDSGIEELDRRSSSDHHLDRILALSGAGARDRQERGGGGEGRREANMPVTHYETLSSTLTHTITDTITSWN